MQAVLNEAMKQYQRTKLMDEANTAYAALRADPEAWKEELEERQAWDATLGS